MSAESGIAIVPARPIPVLPVLYRVLKDVDFDGFSGFVGFPDFALPVFGIQEPPPTVGSRIEVEIPVSVRPFQRDFAPVQGHLRIRIERSDVGPSTGTVLAWIRHGGIVRVLGIRRPSGLRQVRIVVSRTARLRSRTRRRHRGAHRRHRTGHPLGTRTRRSSRTRTTRRGLIRCHLIRRLRLTAVRTTLGTVRPRLSTHRCRLALHAELVAHALHAGDGSRNLGRTVSLFHGADHALKDAAPFWNMISMSYPLRPASWRAWPICMAFSWLPDI